MLPQFVIDAMRSGVPIVGAMVGPSVARGRGRQVSTVKHLAAYSFGGWLAGYLLQRAVFWGLDALGQRRLPTEVASLQGLAQPRPAAHPPDAKPEATEPADKAEVQNDGVRVLDEKDNLVPMKVQSHMGEAYGSEL